MTNTTINAVAEVITTGRVLRRPDTETAKAAIEAYEKASVKEMTVEEVANIIRDCTDEFEGGYNQPVIQSSLAKFMATNLAKLGTIRIVEEKENENE